MDDIPNESAPKDEGRSAAGGGDNAGGDAKESSSGNLSAASPEETLEWAQRYIGNGWRVFPLYGIRPDGQCACGIKDCKDAGKHPRGRNGVKEASSDLLKIAEWFGPGAKYPTNIGLATGEVSGITVVDIDMGIGKTGVESWQKLNAGHIEPNTMMAETGGGGAHLIFRYCPSLKNTSNTYGKENYPYVDCRNNGGYVVVAPSLHRSGERYKWFEADTWATQTIAFLPEHLATVPKGKVGRPRKDDPTRRKYSIQEVRSMLDAIPADDRDRWRNYGIILGREFNRVEDAWAAYRQWADKWSGHKARNHDLTMHEAFHVLSQQPARDKDLSIGSILADAIAHGWAPKTGIIPIDHFVCIGTGNHFVYRPSGDAWIDKMVNAVVSPVNESGKSVPAADWLRVHMLATTVTSDPALGGDYIKGFNYRDGELVAMEGAAVYNKYQPPTIESGDAALATPFIDHVRKVFPQKGDADQFLDYMAHRVQKPAVKPRFALLIAGDIGVGKDTAIDMCVPAIGQRNMANINPADLDGNFNEFSTAILVRVSEASNTNDMSKWSFNERMKNLIAGAPDFIDINPKYGKKYSATRRNGTIVTTNHLHTGVYIAQNDRRYDVIESASLRAMGFIPNEEEAQQGVTTDDKRGAYFDPLWAWFYAGGNRHIAAFLRERDISKFSPASGQRKTEAHHAVVAIGLNQDKWLIDALAVLGEPAVVRGDAVTAAATKSGDYKIESVTGKLSTAMVRAGYVPFRNPARKNGLWPFAERRTMIFCLADMAPTDVLEKVQSLPEPGF